MVCEAPGRVALLRAASAPPLGQDGRNLEILETGNLVCRAFVRTWVAAASEVGSEHRSPLNSTGGGGQCREHLVHCVNPGGGRTRPEKF